MTGKAKAGMAQNAGCAGKTVLSLDNACLYLSVLETFHVEEALN